MTNIEQQARDAHQRKVENAVRNVLVDALAWASTYGSVIPGHQWDEMRDAKVAGYLTTFAALSGPDNAEAVCPNCDRLTDIRHCQACGCDFANPSTAATVDNAEAMFHLRSYGDVTERELMELANPTPAARVSVSDEDLRYAGYGANFCEQHGDRAHAAAIRRLVQAVKGEG